jgi:hypothetical protein
MGKTQGKLQWEIIADQIHKAGWSYGYCKAIVRDLGEVCIVDAHRHDGHWHVVHAPTLIMAFSELQRVISKVPQ